MDDVLPALRFVRQVTGADRCSLVVRSAAGGSEIFSVDGAGEEHRQLSVVPRQLFDHFQAHPGAELRRDLAGSAFESDRSLAKRGFAEVVRAPLIAADGAVLGLLNVIRTRPEGTERDRLFVERMAAALAALR